MTANVSRNEELQGLGKKSVSSEKQIERQRKCCKLDQRPLCGRCWLGVAITTDGYGLSAPDLQPVCRQFWPFCGFARVHCRQVTELPTIISCQTRKDTNFRPATLADFDLLRLWQEGPHVSRWWGREDPFDEEDLADPRVSRWIVSLEQRSFAYMQDYAVHGWGEHHFAFLPEGSRGIDQYIGETEMIGKGHGTAFIRQRMAEMFSRGVPVVATDPHPENLRAIAVYQKAGFQIAGTVQQTKWGLVLPMVARSN
ncbi:MAG: acetyltransferase [Sphingomonadales bacterium]|nr:acetyltransferase [Sphingomonadales bacterium]